ncbi:hypothetical protein [Dokdonella ginsengisoli]|uniref:Uncharacterized protein n=1 Tax=Dokdonella ginsengisoli TaxID=363846 RepID=A0ABV9QXX1_9GAMM
MLKEHGGNGYFAKTKGWAAMEASMRREIAAKWLAIFVIPCALLWLTINGPVTVYSGTLPYYNDVVHNVPANSAFNSSCTSASVGMQ